MHIWSIALVLVISGSAVIVERAMSQELPTVVSRLLQLDRDLAEICKTIQKDRKSKAVDKFIEKWNRRLRLSKSLDDKQRHEVERKSRLTKRCREMVKDLAERRARAERNKSAGWGARAERRARAEWRARADRLKSLRRKEAARSRPYSAPRARPRADRAAPSRDSVLASVPELFPWPPPRPSTRRAFSPDVFLRQPPAKTVGEVAKRLEQIMKAASFDAFGYYRVPGGFALVTRVEALDGATGKPLPGDKRWGTYSSYAGVCFTCVFALTRSRGHYRIFVFALTDDPRMGSRISSAEMYRLATKWSIEGALALSPEIKAIPVGNQHMLIVMVYEFEKVDGGQTTHFFPSRWSLDIHLSSINASLKPQQ